MKKLLQITLVALAIIGCAKSFDPNRIELGMTSDQVIKAVGEPEDIRPMLRDAEFWRYEDDHVVLMHQDEVLNVGTMTDEQYIQTIKGIDSVGGALPRP